MGRYAQAVIFDLDGVLTDTAELHYQSWQALANQLGLPFDRRANEALRGLNREESLRLFLDSNYEAFTIEQRRDLLIRKNEDYLQRATRITTADLFPGVERLLRELRAAGFGRAIASASRNARIVIERLQIAELFDVIVDGNDAPRSKPDPMVFELAAQRLGVAPAAAVVVEDAASGVEAARRAGMKVIGIGSPVLLACADRVTPAVGGLRVQDFLALLASPAAPESRGARL